MDSSQACTIVLFTVFLTACHGQECEPRDQSASCPDRPCSEDRTCARAAKTCECVPNCGWSCVPVGCRSLDSPENGFVTYDTETRSVGSTATFSCLYGHVLSGNVQLECLENKEWNAPNDASCDCQRDDEQLQGRVCMKPCNDDTDCRNNRECLCDDICGLSCIRTALQDYCNVSAIRREGVDVVLNRDTAVFGSVATVTCSPGYVPVSGESGLQLHCLGNNEWSGGSLVCIPEDACRGPPEFENALLADGDKQYYPNGDRARYKCKPGYALSGESIIFCIDGNWSNADISCQAKSCGYPEEGIENGRIVGTVFTFANSITYVCDAGFKLSGSSTRYCQSTQDWTGDPPTCIPVQCQEIPEPANGQKYQSSRGYGDQINFSCDEGFSLYGEPVLTCQNDETWSASAPTCTGYCPTPDETVSWTFNEGCQGDAEQPNGCGLSYTCEGDFAPVYKGIIWSCEGGDWNRKSQPICRETSCNSTNLPLVKVVQERRIIGEAQVIPDDDEGKSSSMTAHKDDSALPKVYDNGHILNVKCPGEYKIFHRSKILRCVNGEWEWKEYPRMPYCIHE